MGKKIKELLSNRLNIMNIFIGVLLLALLLPLANLQLVQGKYYAAMSDKRMYKSTPIKAPRGEIVDRYGNVMVTNTTAYSVIINHVGQTDEELNGLIYRLLSVFESKGIVYEDALPVSYAPYTFTENLADAEKAAKWKKENKLEDAATAEQAMEHFVSLYEIDKTVYDEQAARKIAGVRYDMVQKLFNARNSFTIMKDVNMEILTMIKENNQQFENVDIISEPVRSYPNGTLAAHVLGNVGSIYKEEYETLQDQGYSMNDLIGKDGIEKYLEQYLRGEDGRDSIQYNTSDDGVVLAGSVAAVPGDKAVLTLDSRVQKTAEESLAQAVTTMRASGAHDANSGAVVAIEVNSGDVLAMASYPTFNPATFQEDYSKLVNDSSKPLWNRAISGTYAPGSTFKPLTAIASITEGVTGKYETINCTGVYDYYKPSYTPACWIYNDYGGRHGPLDVRGALSVSCNIFFFESARRLGIEKLNEYGKKFGLGQATGIELSGEASGILAGPEEREERGGIWYPGDTIQAAIGQSDNLFTILQIANYCATIANGGTRYKPHLVKKVVKYDGSETVMEVQPEVAEQINIDPEVLSLVHQGMEAVVNSGVTVKAFEGSDIKAAGKTGTAQVSGNKTPNSLFMAFAPADNPQVAVACIVENGGVNGIGYHVARVARNIFETYLGTDLAEDAVYVNTLLAQ